MHEQQKFRNAQHQYFMYLGWERAVLEYSVQISGSLGWQLAILERKTQYYQLEKAFLGQTMWGITVLALAETTARQHKAYTTTTTTTTAHNLFFHLGTAVGSARGANHAGGAKAATSSHPPLSNGRVEDEPLLVIAAIGRI